MGFFDKLFGIQSKLKEAPSNKRTAKKDTNPLLVYKTPLDNVESSGEKVPEIVHRYRGFYSKDSLKSRNALYFQLLEEILKEDKKGNDQKVLQHCQASLGLIESLIQYNKREYGSFEIKGIPAIEYSLKYFSLQGNIGQLKNVRDIVNYFEEISFYRKHVDEAFERLEFIQTLYEYLKSNPLCWQAELKKVFTTKDPHFILSTIDLMEERGKIKKQKIGRKVLLSVI